MYSHIKDVATGGTPVAQAKGAMIMLHGRGASAEGILSFASEFAVKEIALFAPQATYGSWYPESFMAPVENNQPALDSALNVIHSLVRDIVAAGIPKEEIYFFGFSQGACLALEYTSRNAATYKGIIAFTGGLIGQQLAMANYTGDFNGTPVLITTSNPDAHVPLKRVKESGAIMENMHGSITVIAYPGKAHNISKDEVDLANKLFFTKN